MGDYTLILAVPLSGCKCALAIGVKGSQMDPVVPIFVACTLGLVSGAFAQTDTTFTYQGSLHQAGVPASGSYNIDARLFDAATGGTQIGTTQTFNGIAISDGEFTIDLDFGPNPFDGNQRWLAIGINGTSLSPRQPITAAPASISTRGLFVDANNNVSVGTPTNPVTLSVDGSVLSIGPGGGAFSTRNPNNQTASFTLGWLNDVARLRIGGDGPGASGGLDIQRTGDASLMRILHNGNVGIGTTTPGAMLEVLASTGTAIRAESMMGNAIRGTTSSEGHAGVVGYHEGSGEGNGVNGVTFGAGGAGVRGHANSQTGNAYGVEGSCNNASGYDFYANGAGLNYGAASSRRWKHNVVNIDDPLAKIARLRGVYFDWDQEHGGHHDVGFIAEEVGVVLPQIVNYEDNGTDAIGMDYSKVTPLLVEAVNALRAEKDAEIAVRDERIGHLEDRVAALEQMVMQLADTQSKGQQQ